MAPGQSSGLPTTSSPCLGAGRQAEAAASPSWRPWSHCWCCCCWGSNETLCQAGWKALNALLCHLDGRWLESMFNDSFIKTIFFFFYLSWYFKVKCNLFDECVLPKVKFVFVISLCFFRGLAISFLIPSPCPLSCSSGSCWTRHITLATSAFRECLSQHVLHSQISIFFLENLRPRNFESLKYYILSCFKHPCPVLLPAMCITNKSRH